MDNTNINDFMTNEEIERYDLAVLTSKHWLTKACKSFASFNEEDVKTASDFKKKAEIYKKTADDILNNAKIRHIEELNEKDADAGKLELDKTTSHYKWFFKGKPYTGVAYSYTRGEYEGGVGYYISIAALTEAVNMHRVITTHWFRCGQEEHENVSEIVIPFLQTNQWYILSRVNQNTFVFNIGIPTPVAFWANSITMEAIEGSDEPVEDLETLLHQGEYQIDKFSI